MICYVKLMGQEMKRITNMVSPVLVLSTLNFDSKNREIYCVPCMWKVVGYTNKKIRTKYESDSQEFNKDLVKFMI